MDFEYDFREKIGRDVFDIGEARALLHHLSGPAVQNRITRSGLVNLKKGLYLFPRHLRRETVSRFAVSAKLYGPGYVSFESALSHHGLIPEAVPTTTSACYRRKKKVFDTEVGDVYLRPRPLPPLFYGGLQRRGREGGLGRHRAQGALRFGLP